MVRVLKKIVAGLIALPLVVIAALAFRIHSLAEDGADAVMDWGWGDLSWAGDDPAND